MPSNCRTTPQSPFPRGLNKTFRCCQASVRETTERNGIKRPVPAHWMAFHQKVQQHQTLHHLGAAGVRQGELPEKPRKGRAPGSVRRERKRPLCSDEQFLHSGKWKLWTPLPYTRPPRLPSITVFFFFFHPPADGEK